MSLAEKLFGSFSDRELKKINPITKKVLALETKYQPMSDAELQAQTPALKERLANGETLDDILPDAFAVCREAAWRVLGMKHFPVQIMGGIALHRGSIAEMQTGEGKTLVATLPAYLNALTGEGVHIVTVNDYLAKRDSEWMGKLYRWLGLNVGLIVQGIDGDARRRAYNADITYGTNNEYGFDYLRDNMVTYKDNMVQRGHAFAIVDEVDSILIDEARTPLIISGRGEDSSSLYTQVDRFVRTLRKSVVVELEDKVETDEQTDGDYVVDEKHKSCTLTAKGIKKAEEYFKIENLAAAENMTLAHHIDQAIKAYGVMKKDIDYVVKNGEVIIVDEFTGRLMIGRRYNEGLHQAIEAKEGVKIAAESKTLATITFQNYFRMYKKLAGMTGTAKTEATEFTEIYGLNIVTVPTNRPNIRKDYPDAVYKTVNGKYKAVIEQVMECHKNGQPVLVGTVSVEKSETLAKMLQRYTRDFNVLNAKNHEREAEIVAQAGKKGAITIATNMAGRGTDIMLGGNAEFMAKAQMRKEHFCENLLDPEKPEDADPNAVELLLTEANGHGDTTDENILAARKRFDELYAQYKPAIEAEADEVRKAGGLFIIGTERHESRRIDNQLRGRAGRQGDPGASRFYLSLEDDLMRLFGGDRVSSLMDTLKLDEDTPIENRMITSTLESAQKKLEGRNFEIRKNVLKYDDVMNKQRTVIYSERQAVLKGEDIHKDILRFISDTVESYIKGANKGSDKPKDWDWEGLFKALNAVYPIAVDSEAAKDAVSKLKGDKAVVALQELIVSDAKDQYADFEGKLGEEGLRQLERRVVLAVLDRKWREHLYEMDYLKDGIGLRGMGQRDPLVEYQREGYQMYNSMIEAIKEETIQLLFHVDIDRVATTEDTDTESDEDEAVNAAEAVMGLGGETEPTGETAPAEPETDDESEKTVIDELADEQKNEPGIVGMQPISHAEGKVPANKRPNCTPHGRMAVPSRELARTPSARVVPVASTRCATDRTSSDASHKPRRWPRRCVSYCLGHRHIRGSHSGCHSLKSMSPMASVAGMRTSGPQIQLKTGLFTKGPRSPSP